MLYSNELISKNTYDICNVYDQTVFKSKVEYEFELTVTISYDDTSVSKSDSTTLIANSPPQNGSCQISPTSGVVFADTYNVSCFDWTDSEYSYNYNYTIANFSLNDVFDYYYFYDYSLNLNLKNDPENVIDYTGYGNHTITVAILDDLSLATCYHVSIIGNFATNDTNYLQSNVSHFTGWLSTTYQNLVETQNDSIDDILLLSNIAYDISNVFINENNQQLDTYEDGQQLVSLQSQIIDTIINVSNTQFTLAQLDTNTYSSIISTLATVSQPWFFNLSGTATVGVVEKEYRYTTNHDQYIFADLYSTHTVNSVMSFLSVTLLNSNLSNVSIFSIDNVVDVVSVATVLDNIVQMRLNLNKSDTESQTEAIKNGETLIDIFNQITSSLLGSDAVAGEQYNGEYDTYSVQLGKVAATSDTTQANSLCNVNNANDNANVSISVSDELLEIASNLSSDAMNCATILTQYNIFNVTSYNDNEFLSDFLSFNIFSAVIDTQDEIWLSSCEPVILVFNISSINITTVNESFPLCMFFNETSSLFDTNGCYVVSLNDYTDYTTVECACKHTTFFSLSAEEFTPSVNYEILHYWDDISFESLEKNSLGWIVVISWLVLVTILILICHFMKPFKSYDRPLIAHKLTPEMATYIHKNKDKFFQIQKETIIGASDNELAPWKKIIHLWWINLKNNHTWMSLCCRGYGTNETNTGRLLVICIKLLSTMAIGSVFYGESKSTTVGDWMLSLYSSLFSFLPVKLMTYLLKQRKPSEKDEKSLKSSIHLIFDRYRSTFAASVAKQRSVLTQQQEQQQQQHNTHVTNASISVEHDVMSVVMSTSVSPTVSPKTTGSDGNYNFDDNDIKPDHNLHRDRNRGARKSAKLYVLLQALQKKRRKMLHKSYKLPRWCKYLMFACIICWSILCAYVTIIWCIFFNAEISQTINEYESQITTNCSYDIDVNLQNILNYNASQHAIDVYVKNFDGNLYNPPKNDSFGDYDTSTKFLLQILVSTCLSYFVWSPIFQLINALYFYCKRKYKIRKHNANYSKKFIGENAKFDATIDGVELATIQEDDTKSRTMEIAGDSDAHGNSNVNENNPISFPAYKSRTERELDLYSQLYHAYKTK